MVDENHANVPLFIRADAGGATGTGHVMRMLALAQGWKDRFSVVGDQCSVDGSLKTGDRGQGTGKESSVVFICVRLPEALERRLRDEGFEVVRIDAEPGSEADVHATLAVIGDRLSVVGSRPFEDDFHESDRDQSPNTEHRKPTTDHRLPNTDHWLVTDGYHFDYAYQKAIKAAGLSLLCVDDHGYSERWCCDAILNQNLDAEQHMQYANDIAEAKYLLGADFCLLRKEFREKQTEKQAWGPIRNLLVTLGGSDPENATEAVLQLLNSACERPLTIRVLAGVDNPHLDQLKTFESHHSIQVLTRVTDMPSQYAWVDGIISAGGSTCWEWLHAGLPGAVVTIADNQLPIVRALTKTRRAALPLGWFQEFDAQVQGQSLAGWLEDPSSGADQDAAQLVIDGFGASRVAVELYKKPFFLRSASTADCKRVWEWMNDPTVRQMSFQSDPIPWETHVEWWNAKLRDPSTCLRIVENRQLGAFGVIRFDLKGNDGEAVVSVALSPNSRGRGLGTQVIQHATLQFLNITGLRKVLAYTKEENQASIHAFQKAGYSSPEPAQIGAIKACLLAFELSK